MVGFGGPMVVITLGLELFLLGGLGQNNRTRDNFTVMINDLAASAMLFGILKDDRGSKKDR